MRSHNLFLILTILILLGGSVLFFTETPTGRAIAGFGASVDVQSISFGSGFGQNDTPVVNGSTIGIFLNVTYYGSDLANISVQKPSGFGSGFGWQVNESGVIKNVTKAGSNLEWEANLSVGNATLFFVVDPPNITTIIEETTDVSYTHRVLVSSPAPLRGVQAHIAVPSGYANYRLYLIENTSTDVTSTYSLQVSNGQASWSGFHLSNRTFEVRADATDAPVQSSGSGNSEVFVCIDCNVRCRDGSWATTEDECPVREVVDEFRDRIVVSPTQVDLTLVTGSMHQLVFSVSNYFSSEQVIQVASDTFEVLASEVVVPADGSASVDVLVRAGSGFSAGEVVFSGLDTRVVVPVSVEATRVVVPEPIFEPIIESPQTSYDFLWLLVLVLIGLVVYYSLKE